MDGIVDWDGKVDILDFDAIKIKKGNEEWIRNILRWLLNR